CLAVAGTTPGAMLGCGSRARVGADSRASAVDAWWPAPPCEKLLCARPQLARLCLHAAQATGEPAYRRVVEETLDYVLREMTHPTGGFFSTQDADSEGEEGRFFLWDEAEVRAVLDPDAARAALLYWGLADA